MKKTLIAAALLTAMSAHAEYLVHNVELDVSNINPGSKESINNNRSRVSVKREQVGDDGTVYTGTLDVGPADLLRLRGGLVNRHGTFTIGQGPNSAETAIAGDIGQVVHVNDQRSLISRSIGDAQHVHIKYDSLQYGPISFSLTTDGSANVSYRTGTYGLGISTGKSYYTDQRVVQVGALVYLGGVTLAAGINNDITHTKDITASYRFNDQWRASATYIVNDEPQSFGPNASVVRRTHTVLGVGYQLDRRTEIYAGVDVKGSTSSAYTPATVIGFRYSF